MALHSLVSSMKELFGREAKRRNMARPKFGLALGQQRAAWGPKCTTFPLLDCPIDAAKAGGKRWGCGSDLNRLGDGLVPGVARVEGRIGLHAAVRRCELQTTLGSRTRAGNRGEERTQGENRAQQPWEDVRKGHLQRLRRRHRAGYR